jgi:hypothetical protein
MASALKIVTNQVATATNGLADIRPLKSPVEIPSGWAWLWWTLGSVAVVAVVAWLVWYFRRRAQVVPPPPPPEPAHIRARRRLEAALGLLSDPKQFCVEVSDTLRWYLEQRFELRAPERTTEEFLNDLSSTLLLEPAQKARLAAFLQECDLVKFARFEPTEESLRRLHAAALRLVDESSYTMSASPAAAPAGGGHS